MRPLADQDRSRRVEICAELCLLAVGAGANVSLDWRTGRIQELRLMELLVLLAGPAESLPATRAGTLPLAQLDDFLEDHYSDQLSLAALARMCGMSGSSLSR